MKAEKQEHYAAFKKKAALKLTAAAAAGAALILLSRSLVSGRAGDMMVRLIMAWTKLDEINAAKVYFFTVRNFMEPLIGVGIVAVILLSFVLLTGRFTGSFDKIGEALDSLTQDRTGEISLPPELGYLENKLVRLQQQLERERNRARLEEKRKNDLLLYSAHDIRNPMTSVLGYLILLEDNPELPTAEREKYTGIALKKARELDSMINQLFETASYSLHETVLDKREIDLFSMLDQMKAEHYPELKSGNKSMEIRGEEDLLVNADGERLARAFNNLIKNAILYSDVGSCIEVDIRRSGENAVLSFKNQCRPLPEDRLSLIFEQYYRAGRKGTGTGLGLTIAREIILLHGGSIEARNYAQGLEFIVNLPLAPGADH